MDLSTGRFEGISRLFDKKILDTGCYEHVNDYIIHVISPHKYRKRSIFRIKLEPECVSRMIKRGYYKNNKSLGASNDFERAFMGFNSPMLKEINQIKENNKHLFE